MAENPIRTEDIIDKVAVLEALQEIALALKKVQKGIKDVTKVSKGLLTTTKKLNVANEKEKEQLKAAATQAEKLSAEQRELIRIEKQLISTKAKLNTALTNENKELIKTREAVNKLNRETKLQQKIDNAAAGSLNRMRAQLIKLKSQYAAAGTTLRGKLRPQVNKLNDEVKRLEGSIGDNQRNVGNYKSAIKGLGTQMLGFTGIVGGAVIAMRALSRQVKGAIMDFANFETGQLNAQSLLDEFDKTLESRTIGLMTKYGLEIEDTNKALFDAISAGASSAESTILLAESAELAIAGVTDLTTATRAINLVLNGYDLAMSEAGNVADAFFSAQKKGVTTVALLSNNIGKAIPVARGAGVSYQELLAIFAGLTKTLGSTEETATAIRNVIQSLIAPGEKAKKAFKEMGIETGITAIQQNGLFETLKQVITATETDKDKIVELIPNIRGLTGVLALNEEKLRELDEVYKLVSEDIGETSSKTKAFEAQMDSLNKQLDIEKAKFKAVRIEIGQGFKPAIIGATKALTSLFKFMKNFDITDFSFAKLGENFVKGMFKAKEDIVVINDEIVEDAQITSDELVAIDTEKRAKIRVKSEEALKWEEQRRKTLDAENLAATSKEIEAEGIKLATLNEMKLVAHMGYISDKQAIDAEAAALARELALETANEQKAIDLQLTSDKLLLGQVLLGEIGRFAKKGSAIQKAAAIAEKGIALGRAIIAFNVAKMQAGAALPFPFNLPLILGVVATLGGLIGEISGIKFKHGGYGDDKMMKVGGKSHMYGGTQMNVELEKGEVFGVINRQMSERYKGDLPSIFDSLNSGQFHDIWGGVTVEASHDPYTRKMYEIMKATPSFGESDKYYKEWRNGKLRLIPK